MAAFVVSDVSEKAAIGMADADRPLLVGPKEKRPTFQKGRVPSGDSISCARGSSKDRSDAIMDQLPVRHPDELRIITIVVLPELQRFGGAVKDHAGSGHDGPQQHLVIVIFLIEPAPLTRFHPSPNALSRATERARYRAAVSRRRSHRNLQEPPALHMRY
jgi:hypothetical protein